MSYFLTQACRFFRNLIAVCQSKNKHSNDRCYTYVCFSANSSFEQITQLKGALLISARQCHATSNLTKHLALSVTHLSIKVPTKNG